MLSWLEDIAWRTGIKRMRCTTRITGFDASNSIKFGRRRRALPRVLDKVALAFCALEDLGALSVCSHGLCTLAIEVLASTTATECHLSNRDGARGLSLLASRPSLPRRLTSLIVTIKEHIRIERKFALLILLLKDIIKHHRVTPERLESPSDSQILTLLTNCPNLRYFSLVPTVDRAVDRAADRRWGSVKECQLLADKLLNTGCRLSHLDVQYDEISFDTLASLLLVARLQQLTLRNFSGSVLNMLQSIDVSSLHTLALHEVAMDSLFLMAEDFRGFLKSLPALTNITLDFGHSIQNTEYNAFELPRVTHIVQHRHAIAFVAPKLQYFTGPLPPAAIIALTRQSPHLVSLQDTTHTERNALMVRRDRDRDRHDEKHSHEPDVFSEKEIVRNDEITAAICSNVWRKLRVLQLEQPVDLLALGEALLLWKDLKVLKLRLIYAMPANVALRMILSAVPAIEELSLDDSVALQSMYNMLREDAQSADPEDVVSANKLRSLALTFGDDTLFAQFVFPELEDLHLTGGPRAKFKTLRSPGCKTMTKLRNLYLKNILREEFFELRAPERRPLKLFRRYHFRCKVHQVVD